MQTTDRIFHAPRPAARPLRLLVTGGSGVLGRAFAPIAWAAGHRLALPSHAELDLFDPVAVAGAIHGIDAVVHLASRIQSLDRLEDTDAWHENDRLRADASRRLVDAALAGDVGVYVQPTVTFVYPRNGPATEDAAINEVSPVLESALAAERQTERFSRGGRGGVALRLGLLDGPGTGHDRPVPGLGATLHVADAASALLCALTVPSGIYNVCRDHESVPNRRFKQAAGWRPRY